MFVIGVAGGSGCGKSTLIDQLRRSDCGSQISVLPHDAYYLDAAETPESTRISLNWDHPDALDNRLFVEHIHRLRSGQAIEQPSYDFVTHTRRRETVPIEPRPVLLLDGILLFAVPEIRDCIDLRVFVDARAEVRLGRRIVRDMNERGRSRESVLTQYRATVEPMHEQFVEPSKSHAHRIVSGESDDGQTVEMFLNRIREILRE